ncbi:IS5 family transposase [Xanthomonas citri]|uniref:IS5 family transposase n=1 Tax=Xanthomonas citri TaxID=346 RepID=UPI00031948DD|nr:IS5 family transposase [Xanthomonas citri]AMU97950.1 transposase [Xanthomonas citri pv. aurantifolii]
MGKRKQTRREIFLAEMEQVVPWQQLLALIAPHYPVSGRPGRQPYALATMLRIHLLQQWYALSDPAMEEALHEIPTLRRFAQLGGLDDIPDETTILNFRRLLETHGLAARMLEAVNAHLARKGQSLRSGTIVDATLIAAPSSTKNADHARDPEMHQTRKGNQWYFGMKAHIGVDEFSGLVHHVHCTAANVADVTVTHALLHGKEDSVFGDSGYTGADKRQELRDCQAVFFIAARPSTMRSIGNTRERAREQRWEHFKASVRAKVEHPFRVIKRQFGYTKVRYRGLAKNTAQVLTLFALSNLWMKRKQLLPAMGSVRL